MAGTSVTIQHPPSVVILPVLDDGRVVLIRQFRHAVNCRIYEIPAGTREPGEPALACAKRELMEEAGYSASRWKWVCEFYPAPGISTERMDLFVATALKKLKKRLPMDKDEQITVHPVPARRALQLVRRNKIIDAKSIIGIVWGLNRINWLRC
jgi:ADP-ribose pyrophosphatase